MLTTLLFFAGVAQLSRAALVDLLITNGCSDTIWPAISTQAGGGPDDTGFELRTGDTRNLTVDTNWNGRVVSPIIFPCPFIGVSHHAMP